MRFDVLSKVMLTDIIDPSCINSIVLLEHNTYHTPRKSLAITLKSDADYRLIRSHALTNQRYGLPQTILSYFVTLDKYTYTFPYYAALPERYWDKIQIIEYRVENGHVFIKARLLTKVEF